MVAGNTARGARIAICTRLTASAKCRTAPRRLPGRKPCTNLSQGTGAATVTDFVFERSVREIGVEIGKRHLGDIRRRDSHRHIDYAY